MSYYYGIWSTSYFLTVHKDIPTFFKVAIYKKHEKDMVSTNVKNIFELLIVFDSRERFDKMIGGCEWGLTFIQN